MHLMVQHHCSSTDLALMLFLVGSVVHLYFLSSTCPPRASENFGSGQMFLLHFAKGSDPFWRNGEIHSSNSNCMFQ
jgi:hypothetical protein